MRIAIDLTPILMRSAGVKSYLFHWFEHLRIAASTEDQIRGFPWLDELGSLNHEASTISPSKTVARLAMLTLANNTRGFGLNWMVGGADVLHASNLMRQTPSRARLTATLHDLTTWTMPESHTSGNIHADQYFAERILKPADALIAVSENTRQDAIRLLGISPERIRTIHSGIAGHYFHAVPRKRARPYVLYVGTIEPRKNLPKLLDAWAALKPDLRREFDLVIAGPQGWHSTETMARVRAEGTYLGYVPEADMPGLFASATAFAYPSLYEGFGFPVAQAMATGTPVLTSNTSCLPEVTGDAALLIDPHSVSEITAGLTRLLESESERARLAELGRIRAQQFRWERCAAESLDFFREAAGR